MSYVMAKFMHNVNIYHNIPYTHNSPVDITEKRGEPGKNLKKADFGIIRKHRRRKGGGLGG